jgi:hypothetical protein
MKALKIIAWLLVVYVALVVVFESLLGYFQPANEETLVLVSSADGAESARVLRRLEADGQVYVAVHHWPRGWYHNVLENPSVKITFGGETADYVAVPVTDPEEYARVDGEYSRGIVFLLLTGFPPRELVRLEPS